MRHSGTPTRRKAFSHNTLTSPGTLLRNGARPLHSTPSGACHGMHPGDSPRVTHLMRGGKTKLTHSASRWAARLGLAALAFATPLGAQNVIVNPGVETGNFS